MTTATSWRIRGNMLDACSCAHGCPCQFGADPTLGYCEAKSLALIVYMAREPGPDRRDKILGMLWPDRDEKRARHALNQLLYTLRKASPELDLESIEDALDFGREVWLDVEEFERRLEAGDQRGAVELYEGPFLIDLSVEVSDFDHWADRQRTQVARSFRKAALQLAEETGGGRGMHD